MDEKNFNTEQTASDSDVIHFYDKYAGNWDQRFGATLSTDHFLQKRWKSFEQMLPLEAKRTKGLELGVGTGVYIDKASKLFKCILAIDGSEFMLTELKKKLMAQKILNVEVHQANVLYMPFIPDDSIDVVYFFGLIEHIIDIEVFVSEIRRVLRNNGKVIGITPNGASPWYKLRKIYRGTGKHCSTDKYYTKKEIKELFNLGGFENTHFSFWGGVPAGVSNVLLFKMLIIIEGLFERVPFLSSFLGGITFSAEKKNSVS